MAVVDALSRYIFHYCKVKEIIVYSPISIVNFFSYFCKNIFYNEKSSKPIIFVVSIKQMMVI
jgi:hypothetical protein